MMKPSREFEILVAKIQRLLAPDADVLHDVLLDGYLSERKRQIDVLVRQRIGQYEINIIIDCKDYNKPVDVKDVEEFHGLVSDVRAQKGVLVCPKGFSKAAKKRADGLHIDLYSPVDTDDHKWRASVKGAAICDFRTVKFSFSLAVASPFPFELPRDFYATRRIHDENGKDLGSIIEVFSKQWNESALPTEPGEYRGIRLFRGDNNFMENGLGRWVQVEIGVSLLVEGELYFGRIQISKISGFKDEKTGGVITNAFEFNVVDPDEVEKTWARISSESDAPDTPLISFRGQIYLDYSQSGMAQ